MADQRSRALHRDNSHGDNSPDDISLDGAVALTDIDTLTAEQEACVDAATSGRDVLAVIPTGGGKSAIYQLAAAVVPGITVVVVPLLALAADQRRSLVETGLPPAVEINGSTSEAARRATLEQLKSGEVEYLFITPESLGSAELIAELAECEVSLFVVDEAHCVVTWGQSFRSDYLLLGEVRRELGSPTCVALTASADPRIRDDLVRLLGLDDPLIEVLPLIRENIELSIVASARRDEARQALVDHLAAGKGKAVAYVPTRRHCVELADELRTRGRQALAYHGQLSASDRNEVAEAFLAGTDCVVVATNAFGMGVDVPDIDTVAHLDLPATLIDYYQEIGRAGRDGRAADALAFVALRKRSRRTFTAGVHRTSVEDCARVFAGIASGQTSRRSLSTALDLSLGRIARAITVLSIAGAINPHGALTVLDAAVSSDHIADVCAQREEFDRSQRNAIDAYASSSTCRWQQLLAALGEAVEPCGNCDNCASTGSSGNADPRTGSAVHHQIFGPGQIVAVDGSTAHVTFDEAGPKTLDLDLCIDEGLVTLTN